MLKKIYLAESVHGKGVFTVQDMSKGECIVKFKGEILSKRDEDRPDHYLQIGLSKFLGPSGEIDDFVNHSCDPNSGLKNNTKLYAIKNIKSGEEITFDYSTATSQDTWKMICLCGSKQCRITIGNFEALSQEIKEKYLREKVVPKWVKENIKP